MSNYDTFAVFAAVYDNEATAEQDYEAIKSLYYNWQLIDNFDAAIIAKHDDGKVKIVKKHEQPTRKGGWKGAGWGLATGAVIALFPAAAIGGGFLATTTAGGAAIGAIAGHVSKGMNRGDLKDLGERLDGGEYGLVVVAAADVSAKVSEAIANAQDIVLQKDLQALEDALDADVKAAEEEESS
jgi:uncharacterized membrane protein